MRWFFLILLIPVVAWSECASWKLCPYTIREDNPCSRWLSIARHSLPRWSEIEVDGAYNSGGQALVCFHATNPGDLSQYGCTDANRGQVRALLRRPAMPYCVHDQQGNPNRMEFFDGRQGRADWRRDFNQGAIRREINDSALEAGVPNR